MTAAVMVRWGEGFFSLTGWGTLLLLFVVLVIAGTIRER